MIKINRAKLAPKLMLLAILLITVFTGFACTFAVAKENQRSTKLEFECTEVLYIWEESPPWGDGTVLHMRAYKEALLIDGIIEEIGEFSGYDELDLHVRVNLDTGKMISIGKVTMYIYSEDGEVFLGTFYGPVIAMGMVGPTGPLAFDGKYTLQGTGDFEGMKLFGTVKLHPVNPWMNELSGTILDPN